MNNNLKSKSSLKKVGKFARLLETTLEDTRVKLMKYYTASNKLFNNEILEEKEELLFIQPHGWTIYNPVSDIFKETSKTYPLYILEILKRIFENHNNGNITKEDLSFLEAILNGQIYVDSQLYGTIFSWFYFNNLSYRYDIPMTSNLSAEKYHSYMITRLTQSNIWNKMLNWD